MRLHSGSDFFLEALDIGGGKEKLITVIVVHRYVKLQRLKCCCIFFHSARLFERE
jgi:hypothetical protein